MIPNRQRQRKSNVEQRRIFSNKCKLLVEQGKNFHHYCSPEPNNGVLCTINATEIQTKLTFHRFGGKPRLIWQQILKKVHHIDFSPACNTGPTRKHFWNDISQFPNRHSVLRLHHKFPISQITIDPPRQLLEFVPSWWSAQTHNTLRPHSWKLGTAPRPKILYSHLQSPNRAIVPQIQ